MLHKKIHLLITAVFLHFAFPVFSAGGKKGFLVKEKTEPEVSQKILFKETPIYKNPKADLEQRVKDLLGRMTLEEKVGQISALLGWEMYEKGGAKIGVSAKFRQAIKERHIGMLWATLRADPWTKKTLSNGLSPYESALATNALQKYTLENTRLGIPLFIAEECPHGHMAIGTTVFPTSIGQGSTWNPDLIKKMASAIAREARVQGAHIGYGPVLDLAREPRWSRVEETYGEDPILNGEMGIAMVQGFQGSDLKSGANIISTLKHFTAYGVPEGGHNGGSVNSGLRELYQSYLSPFRSAVKAGAQSVMTAYNSVDGVPCSANPFLLRDVLRNQWGFNGFTVSDLGSIEGVFMTHRVAANQAEAAALAMNAGLDADLGGNGFNKGLIESVKQGKVSGARLDSAVANLLRLKFKMGLFEKPYVDASLAKTTVGTPEHIKLARQVARESIVLLKNKNNVLPLNSDFKKIAVIGPNADNLYNQLGDYTAPQRDEAVVTVLEGIRARAGKGISVDYVKGCAVRDTNSSNIAEAVRLSRNSDITILVLGGSSARDFKTEYISTGAAKVSEEKQGAIPDMESGEGFDRMSLDLLGKQTELLKAVLATGKPVVVVMIEGRPLNLNLVEEQADAILTAWYPGQEGGNAIADVLFGDYNPAGRLPISVPVSVGQLPVYYNYKSPVKHNYVEGSSKPLYSFGYGLSFSSFKYSELSANVEETENKLIVKVRVKVKNNSEREGDEVVQLYFRDDISSVVSADKQLAKFSRVHFMPGEEKIVEFSLHAEDLALYDRSLKHIVEAGSFTLMAGGSSDNLPLNTRLQVERTHFTTP
ncbi:glycoside hydrolase family 3 N-terminal domain-containing protein [Desertivirga brevis]|uniref:glycoside hydrolase family 3 N-terminal domain-containing protein n=1 Tax=Desertivirga brevis TaxID=2810310 RepID=UPI001A95E5CA|nr:glycoside hydrolase family 3 N-terminal domain-containing protein [Pedobacter sp. SYSU D00873]